MLENIFIAYIIASTLGNIFVLPKWTYFPGRGSHELLMQMAEIMLCIRVWS